MGTARQRMIDAFEYGRPERIPVVYHPSPAGLHVHGEKLLELFRAYPPDNPISFEGLPGPSAEAVDGEGRYHELRRDEWGTEWEYLIFGIAGHPKRYPLAGWEAARDYGFPEIPAVGSAAFSARKEEVERLKREFLVFDGWISLFERMHALRPMEEVLIGLASGDRAFFEFLDRLTVYWHELVDYLLGLEVDVAVFGDDWGTQQAPIISPALFREVFRPRYRELMERLKGAGVKVFLHCCGFVGPLFDEFLDLGIDGYWPQITRYDADELQVKCRENGVAIYIHPDRQRLVPLGSPGEIDEYVRGYAERYREGGGIFYVELENDVPFENARALIEAIDRYR